MRAPQEKTNAWGNGRCGWGGEHTLHRGSIMDRDKSPMHAWQLGTGGSAPGSRSRHSTRHFCGPTVVTLYNSGFPHTRPASAIVVRGKSQ
eukprot:3924711-Prymnesium_polylepis.1